MIETNEKLQELLKWAKDNGKLSEIDFNNIDNGIMIAKRNVADEIPGHTQHPNYSRQLQLKLNADITDNFSDSWEVVKK